MERKYSHLERFEFKKYENRRSIVDDNLNCKMSNRKQLLIKIYLALLITLLMAGISLLLSTGLHPLKNLIEDNFFSNYYDNYIINWR